MYPADVEMDMAFWMEISKILQPLEVYTLHVPPIIAIFFAVLMILHLAALALHEHCLRKEQKRQENRLKRFLGKE